MKDIKLVPYTDDDYDFVYEVKKNAYKKYVEECWGSWEEENQKNYFEKFISTVKDNAYIIMYGDKKIGFYNGEILENGNYEVGNICIIPEYQGKGIGKQIMELLLKQIDEYKKVNPDIRTYLGASKNREGFYEKFGFVQRPNEELGAGMILCDEY